MSRPLLSICIPTYDVAPTLEQCLAELGEDLGRLPRPIEVVISQSPPTDELATMIALWARGLGLEPMAWDQPPGLPALVRLTNADGSIQVRMLKSRRLDAIENAMVAHRVATGEFAFQLSHDDRLCPEGITETMTEMQRHPEWIACYGPYHEVDDRDQVLSTANMIEPPRHFDRGDFAGALEFFLSRVYHPEVPLVRTDEFRRHVIRPARTFNGYWAFCSLLSNGAVGMWDRPLYKHRLRPGDPEQMQWSFAMNRMDECRLGYELLVFNAMIQNGQTVLSPEHKARLATLINERMAGYAQVAARVACDMGDHQSAAEWSVRAAVWLGLDFGDLEKATMQCRAQAEIIRRNQSTPGDVVGVSDANARLLTVMAGAPAASVVAIDDLTRALSPYKA